MYTYLADFDYHFFNFLCNISTDTLPSLLDEVHDSKVCTKPVVRTQEEASESDVPHEDEESTHELQLHQSCMYM